METGSSHREVAALLREALPSHTRSALPVDRDDRALRAGLLRLSLVVLLVHAAWFVAWPLGVVAPEAALAGYRHGALMVLGALAVLVAWRAPVGRRGLLAVLLVVQSLLVVQVSLDESLAARSGDVPLAGGWIAATILVFAWLVPASRRLHRWVAGAGAFLALVVLGLVGWFSGDGVGAWVGVAAAPGALAALLVGLFAAASEGSAEADSDGVVQRIGRYALTERLGKGGMGEVWRARHELLTREVAVKLIRADRVEELLLSGGDGVDAVKQMRARFEREARMTAELSSPHTIRIFDFGEVEGRGFYYVMELLDGLDVHTLVRRFGRQPEERVRYILLQACDSLGEAHARGMVHRDVKPANVFVCAAGMTFDHVKLLDFGLVLRSAPVSLPERGEVEEGGEEEDMRLTTAGIVQGTPAYMAPEQVEGVEKLDGRVDIYALGCVAYFLLTGTELFRKASPLRQMIAHLQDPVEDPNGRLGEDGRVSPQFVSLLMRMLEKDPAKRFQDTQELTAALHALRLPRLWGQPEARRWYLEHLAGPDLSATVAAVAGFVGPARKAVEGTVGGESREVQSVPAAEPVESGAPTAALVPRGG
ncbi:MAG: serine/threonine protein kinase [Deltaproteobacteria bacterium]|nr:MAG: serine/threonine protein kinase [Deltaproteobacteria bacterium]